jgi:toxic protein SymE
MTSCPAEAYSFLRPRWSPASAAPASHTQSAGSDRQGGVMKINEECIVLMADNNETQELREQIYQARQMMKGMQDVLI